MGCCIFEIGAALSKVEPTGLLLMIAFQVTAYYKFNQYVVNTRESVSVKSFFRQKGTLVVGLASIEP